MKRPNVQTFKRPTRAVRSRLPVLDVRSTPERRWSMAESCVTCGRFHLCMIVCLCALLLGCEAGQITEGEANGQRAVRSPELDAADRMRRMAGFDLGLELHEWLIHSDVGELGSVLAQWAGEPVTDADLDDRLRRNGLRVFTVPIDELDALEERLRHLGHRQRGWRGQVVRWDPLISRRLRPDQRAVVINGRVRRFNREEFALMARSWIVQMEDGPRMVLQLVPTYQEPDVASYRQMLGHDEERGRALSFLRVELLLKPDEAAVVTSDAPGVTWDLPDTDREADVSTEAEEVEQDRDERGENETSLAAHLDHNFDRSDRRGEHDRDEQAIGPEADMPMTVGELLFDRPVNARMGIRGRGLMIFVPQVTDDLMPPDKTLGGNDRQERR